MRVRTTSILMIPMNSALIFSIASLIMLGIFTCQATPSIHQIGERTIEPLLKGTMEINAEGHLMIGGCQASDLVKLSPYPIYVLDETLVRKNTQAYYQGIHRHYGTNSSIYYASKALMNLAICKIAESENIGLDVSSGGELYTALKAGFPMQNVVLHGNNKSEEELILALQNKVGRIVIDSWDEAVLLSKICLNLQRDCSVLVRVKSGVHAHTHHYIVTGTEDSKFGLSILDGSAIDVIKFIQNNPSLHFKGIHCHIGSQILSMEGYEKSIEIMADFCKTLLKLGIEVFEFDFGGGLGISYTPEDLPVSIDHYIKTISDKIKREFGTRNIKLPKLMLEPGRSIVGDAGTTLYTVGTVKQMQNGLTYVSVNGGMADNIRPALYQAKYHAVVANKMKNKPDCKTRIVGKCCESGDVLISEIDLPTPVQGDIIAVYSTGAYNYTMASNYNRLPIPGVLLVKEGTSHWIVEPETYEDLLQRDIIPRHLSD